MSLTIAYISIDTIDRVPRLTLSLNKLGIFTVPIYIFIEDRIIFIIYLDDDNFSVDRNFVLNLLYIFDISI